MCPLPRASDMTAPGRSPRPGGSAGRIATVLRSRAAPGVQCGALLPRGPQGSRRDPLLDPREDGLRDAGLVAKGRGRHRRRKPRPVWATCFVSMAGGIAGPTGRGPLFEIPLKRVPTPGTPRLATRTARSRSKPESLPLLRSQRGCRRATRPCPRRSERAAPPPVRTAPG
jgi:hypothetical protein